MRSSHVFTGIRALGLLVMVILLCGNLYWMLR